MKQSFMISWMCHIGVLFCLACLFLVAAPISQARAQGCICGKGYPSWCCGDGAAVAATASAATGAQTTSFLTEWGKRISAWTKQFTFLTSIIGLYNVFNDFIHDQLTSVGALINGGDIGLTEARVRIATGVTESNAQSRAAESQAVVAGGLTPPTDDNQMLCNVIGVRQGTGSTRWWNQALGAQMANLIQDRNRGLRQKEYEPQYADDESSTVDGARLFKAGVGERYRGPGNDGDGPQYAGDERDLRCGKINGAKFANPIDGYPASCQPSDASLRDADIHFSTFSGVEFFELPKMTPKTMSGVTINIPTPSNRAQQLYVAAMNFCTYAAGPRPTPPSGKDLDSPEGVAQTAAFDHMTALESVFVSQCTKRAAYLTRPNCNDPAQAANASVQATCTATKAACDKFVAAKGTLPPDIDPTGTNTCPSSLSPYQMDWISHMMCTTSTFYTATAGAGISHGEMMNFSTTCDLGITEWKAKLAKENLNMMKAFRGLMELNYSGTGRTAGKTMRIKDEDGAPLSPREHEEASARDGGSAATKVVAKKKGSVLQRAETVNLLEVSAP